MRSDPINQFKQIKSTDKNPCFLYSANKGKSLIATNPIDKFSGNNIEKFLKFTKKNQKNLLIGYISYDLAYKLHNIKAKSKNDLKLPEIYFLAFKNWSEFKKSKETNTNDNNKSNKRPNKFPIKFKTIITKKEYQKSFKKIKHYIKEGDIYQINLTHRLEATSSIPPRELFLKVIEKNPTDYSAYIEGEKFEILSASPERFIKIINKKIETCPIKGTFPRAKDEKEDLKMSQDLLSSPKEAAELNMITDLLRNDLGKICKKNTVKVNGHRLLQKLPTVWHTFSKISGELSVRPIDALLSMLPGGSITGCPKKRGIEIIDELEPVRRGIYTGVIGYIMPNQKELNFNIAIRTIIKKKNKLYLQVGGGIVLDSKENSEYKETLAKAKSFTDL